MDTDCSQHGLSSQAIPENARTSAIMFAPTMPTHTDHVARTYLNYLKPEYLRYYYAAKLSNSVDDIDLNLEDFQMRVNADRVGKVVNIASRCARFISKNFGGTLAAQLPEPLLVDEHY